MRTLQIHAIEFMYKTMKKAIKKADDAPGEYAVKNALLVLTSIEQHDNENIIEEAVEDIIRHAQTVKANEIIVYPYAHLSNQLAPPSKAVKLLEELNKKLEERGWKTHRAPFGWYKEFFLHAAGHPLAELSRTFHKELKPRIHMQKSLAEKILKEYLPRFGLTLEKERIIITKPWKTLLQHYHDDTLQCIHKNIPKKEGLCQGTNIIETEILPEKIKLIDYLVQQTSDPQKMLKNTKITIEDDLVKAEAPEYKAIIGIINNETRYLLLNSFLITLIADRLKGLEKGEVPTLPLEYSPIQAIILVIGSIEKELVETIKKELVKAGLKRIETDDSPRKIGDKIRYSGKMWIPITIIVGKREAETNTVVMRVRKDNIQTTVKINEIATYIKNSLSKWE